MIDLFPWNNNFETGIDIIDSQHKKLVHLINQLAVAITHREQADNLGKIFISLAEYAQIHFSTEEKIWEKYFSSGTDYQNHKNEHSDFIKKVSELKLKNSEKPSVELHKKIF